MLRTLSEIRLKKIAIKCKHIDDVEAIVKLAQEMYPKMVLTQRPLYYVDKFRSEGVAITVQPKGIAFGTWPFYERAGYEFWGAEAFYEKKTT